MCTVDCYVYITYVTSKKWSVFIRIRNFVFGFIFCLLLLLFLFCFYALYLLYCVCFAMPGLTVKSFLLYDLYGVI